MALIICPECNKEISDKAKACPYCGCPAEFFPKANATEKTGTNSERHSVEKKDEGASANLGNVLIESNMGDDFSKLFTEGALKSFDFNDKSVRNLCLLLDQLIGVCKKNGLEGMPKNHKQYKIVSTYVSQVMYGNGGYKNPYLFSHFSRNKSIDEYISDIRLYNRFMPFFHNCYLKGDSTDWFKENLFDSNGYMRMPTHPIRKVTTDPEGDLLFYLDTSMTEDGRKGIALTKEYIVDLKTLNKYSYSNAQVNISSEGKKLFISSSQTTGMELPMSDRVDMVELYVIGNLIKDLKNRVASSKPSEYIKQKTGLDRSLDLMYLNRNKKEETKKEITIDFDIDNCGADKRSIRMAKALVKYANDNASDFIKVEKWKAIKTKYPDIRETGEEVFVMMYLEESNYNPVFVTNTGIKTKYITIPFFEFKRVVIDEYRHTWLYYRNEFGGISSMQGYVYYRAAIVLKALLESLNVSDIDIVTQNGKEYCLYCGSVSFRRKFFSQICLECGADTCLGELKTRYDDSIDQEIKHAKESFDKIFEEL